MAAGPGTHEQTCAQGTESPPCPPCRVPRSSARSATPSQRPETCGGSTCELHQGGLASSSPTCHLCDVTLPLVHTCTQVPMYIHAPTHTRTCTCVRLEPEWRPRPSPACWLPPRLGTIPVPGSVPRVGQGGVGGVSSWARLLRSSTQTDRQTDRHADTRLKHM